MTTTTQTTMTGGDVLAIDGGPKAFPGRTGEARPKIGVDEFFAIAERFGFNEAAMTRLRSAVSEEDLCDGGGPNLACYACPNPPNPKGPQFAQAARELFGVKYALPT